MIKVSILSFSYQMFNLLSLKGKNSTAAEQHLQSSEN